MEFETLRYAVSGRVCTVTLCRPEVLNAITPQMLHELQAAVDAAARDPDVGVVVLTGEGRAFSAGVDLKALGGVELVGGAVGELLDAPAREVIRALIELPKVVVAKVQGFCFTGALELALACDLIVVAEEAKLGDTHAKWGLRPTWGMSARLAAAVGITRARELSLTARTFTGAEAAAWGLATRAAPKETLDSVVGDLCAELLANSAESLAAYKSLYRQPEVLGAVDREARQVFEIRDTDARLEPFRS